MPGRTKKYGCMVFCRDYIDWTLEYIKAKNNKIFYIGREFASTPATGYAKRHLAQQKEIINEVFR